MHFACLDTEKKGSRNTKPRVHVVSGDQSVDSSIITSLEQIHLSNTAPFSDSDTKNGNKQTQPTASLEISDTISDNAKSNPDLYEKKKEIIEQDIPIPIAGPKHYGAPSQKVSPPERVIAALLEWKTLKTVNFLKGTEPDLNQLDEPVSDVVSVW